MKDNYEPRGNRLPALPQHRIRRKFFDVPEPGYYKLRLARRGPWVPALIWSPCPFVIPDPHADEVYIGGRWSRLGEPYEYWCCPTDPWRVPRWSLNARIGEADADPLEIWQHGYTITAQEYHYRMGLREWAAKRPEQPEGQPRKAVDLARTPSLF